MADIKNRIVIYTGCFEDKRKVELFNFNEMKHMCIEGVSYIRITCESKNYYFKTIETTIGEIQIY